MYMYIHKSNENVGQISKMQNDSKHRRNKLTTKKIYLKKNNNIPFFVFSIFV